MSQRLSLKVIAFVWTLGFAGAAQASDSCEPAISVTDPFRSAAAKQNLRKIFPKMEPEVYAFLYDLWEYKLQLCHRESCPYSTPDDCEPLRYAEIRRTMTIRGDSLVAEVLARVKALETGKNSCSTLRLPNRRLDDVECRKVTFAGDFWTKKYACTDSWLFGEVETLVGEADGWWRQDLSLNLTPPPEIRRKPHPAKLGEFSLELEKTKTHVSDRKFLVVIDLDTFIGKIVDDLVLEFKLSPVNIVSKWIGAPTPRQELRDKHRKLRSAINKVQALLSGQIGSAEKFAIFGDRVEQIEMDYYLDPQRTCLERYSPGGVASFRFLFSEIAFFRDEEFSLVLRAAQAEKALIESFSKNDGSRTVEPGESLWSIAEDEYGIGDLHRFLRYSNQLTSDVIHPGQTLSVEPLWRLAGFLEDGKLLVPGDTIWDKFIEKRPASEWNPDVIKAPVGSDTIDLVFPLQVLDW